MNILFVSDLADMGGGEVSLLHIMQEMSKNHNICLLTRKMGPLLEKAKHSGIKTYCYDFKSNLIFSIKKFWEILVDNDIGVVHSNELTTGILHGIQIKIINVCTCHGQWYALSKTKEKLINTFIAHIFCVSKTVESNLNRQNINNTSVSYLGIPKEIYRVHNFNSDSLKASMSIEKNTKVIITVARFQRIKGQMKGVQAIEKLLSEYRNIIYFIVGDDIFDDIENTKYKGEIQNYIKKNNLSDRIKLLGERTDIPELMNMADFVMITSDNESFGMVALEAIESNRVIVSTPCDGICEILENSKYMIAKTNSANGLYLVLRDLLENEKKLKKAKDKIHSLQGKFTVEEVCRKYLEGYKKVYETNKR